MKSKRGMFLFALIISMIFLTSCADKTAVPVDSESLNQTTDTALAFRITWKEYSGRGEAIQKIVSAYGGNENGGSAVAMIGGDEDLAAIQTLLGNNSSMIYVLPYRFVKYFGGKGYLTDVSVDFQKEQELFYPKVWELGTVGEKTYGIPWLGHSMCLIYNKTLLEKAGVDAASIDSLSALIKAMEQVEEKTEAKGIGLVGANSNDISWMVNQFIYGFGASLVSSDGKTVTVNSEASKAAIGFYKNELGRHAQPTWLEDTGVEVMTHFRNQEVAFEIQGIWGVTDIQKAGSPFAVGIIAMNEIGLCAEVGPMMLAVPASMNGKMKEDAISFIRYLISSGAQEEIMHGEYSPEHDAYYPFRTPIRTDMGSSDAFQNNPEYVKFIEGFQNPSIDVPVPSWQTVKDEFYGPGLHQVMSNEMTIEDFLAQIEIEGNRLLGAK